MILELNENGLWCNGALYLSKREYAKKYSITLAGLAYMKHKKRVDTIQVLDATFFRDAPPVGKRYKELANVQESL